MADRDFLDYDLLIASGMSPPVANALLTIWKRTGEAQEIIRTLDQLQDANVSASWGSIEGNLSAQEDLQAALDALVTVGRTFLDLGTQSGALTLDYAQADVQKITFTGNTTLSVTGWPEAPARLMLILVDADDYTITLPSWQWDEGSRPAFSAHERIILESEDQGTTVYARRVFGNASLLARTDIQDALHRAESAFAGGDSASSNPDTVQAGDSTASNTDTYIAGAA